MSANTETEVKLYVPDLETVAQRLEAGGAELVTPRVFERNVRYEDGDESFTPQGVVLRLREDERIRLTYKGPGMVSGGIIQRYEAEVEVSSFDTMQAILEHLGYHPHMIYEKYRSTYELDGAEIVLDEMPYGHFVEIEGETTQIELLVTRLRLDQAPRFGVSYVGLFDRVRRNLKLDFRDLSFENFSGIEVPEWAFSMEGAS